MFTQKRIRQKFVKKIVWEICLRAKAIQQEYPIDLDYNLSLYLINLFIYLSVFPVGGREVLMGIQKPLFPSHPLMPPRTTDAVKSEDFLPSCPIQRHPELRGNVFSFLFAQLQTMQPLKSYRAPGPRCECVCMGVPCRESVHSVSLGGRVEQWAEHGLWSWAGLGFILGPGGGWDWE